MLSAAITFAWSAVMVEMPVIGVDVLPKIAAHNRKRHMTTATFSLDQLAPPQTPARSPKKATSAKANAPKAPRKRHWTDAVFKHSDALGDELRKRGITL